MKKIILIIICLFFRTFLSAQEKSVAITMDDLLNAFHKISIEILENSNDSLLNSINELNIPVTVFVNDKSFIKIGETDRRLIIYKKWIDNPLIAIGNHTFSHLKYAETTYTSFRDDIIKGETITKELLKKSNKQLKYFRFPFNCTGKDSITKAEIYNFLHKRGYIITPFTIESSDYMYNLLYCNHLNKGNIGEAEKILKQYIDFTIDLFKYYENITHKLYGRNIRHIFLCHTNRLHTACFRELIERIKEEGYTFISLDEAIEDEIYQSEDYYNEPYGISWIYRWIDNDADREKIIKKEPYSKEIMQQFNNQIN